MAAAVRESLRTAVGVTLPSTHSADPAIVIDGFRLAIVPDDCGSNDDANVKSHKVRGIDTSAEAGMRALATPTSAMNRLQIPAAEVPI